MNLIRLALGNPVAALAGCLLVILFGATTLTHLPIQLVPEVEQPEIVITTRWRAAAPEEVEAEIIEPQEKQAPRPARNEGVALRSQHGSGGKSRSPSKWITIWIVRLSKLSTA